MFFPVNLKYKQRSRKSQIDRREALEALLDMIEDTDSEAYSEHYRIWKRDKVWEIELTDEEIDRVCDDHYLEEKYKFITNYAEANNVKLRQI